MDTLVPKKQHLQKALVFFLTLKMQLIAEMNLQTSKKIFDNMLERIMNAPINLYYDVTPIGTIQARFGKDLKNIDKRLYDRGMQFCKTLFRVI